MQDYKKKLCMNFYEIFGRDIPWGKELYIGTRNYQLDFGGGLSWYLGYYPTVSMDLLSTLVSLVFMCYIYVIFVTF